MHLLTPSRVRWKPGAPVALAAMAFCMPLFGQKADFRRDIQPILDANCKACHVGGNAPANLRLDSAEGMLAGSYSGKVVVAGKDRKSVV